MPKEAEAPSVRDAVLDVFAEFNERWKEVDWNKLPFWKREAIYRVMFYGGVQCEIVLDLKASTGNVSMRMWVVGDFRARSLMRLNRYAKKFLREYPEVTIKHTRVRLTDWGALTKKILKDPYDGPPILKLVLDTTAAGRVWVKKKTKETFEIKRKPKKRGRKSFAELKALAKIKVKPKPLPPWAKERPKLKVEVPEIYSEHTSQPLRRQAPPRADQLPFMPAMASMRDLRIAYKPYFELPARRNRIHLAFDALIENPTQVGVD